MVMIRCFCFFAHAFFQSYRGICTLSPWGVESHFWQGMGGDDCSLDLISTLNGKVCKHFDPLFMWGGGGGAGRGKKITFLRGVRFKVFNGWHC